MAKRKSKKRPQPARDRQVSISGQRVTRALAAAGLSVKAASEQMAERGLARISQSALNSVARGRTATTRASVRAGLAKLVREGLDPGGRFSEDALEAYLSGFGADHTAAELIALRMVGKLWDIDLQADRTPIPTTFQGSAEEIDQQIQATVEPVRRLKERAREKQRTLITVLDLDHWKELLGDSRAVVTEEDRVAFARLIAKAVEFVTELPIADDALPGNRRRKFGGLQALQRVLEGPPPASS